MTVSIVMSALIACTKGGGLDTDSGGGGVAPIEDRDGDGYYSDEDCDDAVPTVYPGALEVCDGLDNNCDGSLDEGVTSTYYADADGDGFGDADSPTEACSRPDGYVPLPNDCDDTDADTWPGADETCDGADNDCDDEVDEEATTTFYADTDGDGYGDPLAPVTACAASAGITADGTDCDDADETVYPGADEACDGVDNDCDGFADEAPTTETVDWYPDADGDGYGDPAGEVYASCIGPAGYADEASDCDDRDAAVNPGAAEVCDNDIDDDCDGVPEDGCPIEHCGTISADETWSNLYLHEVTCDVKVQGSAHPVLTIEDGVTVLFTSGTGLYVATALGGALLVDGASSGVSFTSASSGPGAGDWSGLEIGYYDDGSEIVGLTVEYAGLDLDGAVYVHGEALSFSGGTVRDSASAGLYVRSGGGLDLADSTFEDNAGDGVYIAQNADLTSFSGNTASGNGGYPVTVPAAGTGELDAASSYTGNADDRVRVLEDTISADATWSDLGVPYHVTGDVTLAGGAAPTLRIEDGVELQMDAGVGFTIGRSGHGAVRASGSSAGILFTSAQSSPAPGDWDGLTFGAYDDGSTLEGVTVEYAGGNGYGGIYLYSADPSLENCTLRDNDGSGLHVAFTGAPTVEGCTIEDNEDYGVYVASDAELAVGTTPSFDGNTVTGNGEAPIALPAEYVGQIDASCALSGNGDDVVLVWAGDVTADASWQSLDVDYRLDGDVAVQGSAKPVLEIEAGTTVRFDTGAALTAGVDRGGALRAVGTSSKPVVFTSAASSPAAGDWEGLQFGASCVAADVSLSHVEVSWGGDNGYGNLLFTSCDGAVSHATISGSSSWGIYRDGASPTLTDITYSGNSSGTVY